MRKIRLISKFITPQYGEQRIKIHILTNISRSKGNQILKFGQGKQCSKRNIFFKNYGENEAGRLIADLFLFFKKPIFEVNASGLQLSFNQFRKSSTWQTIKSKYIKL